MAMYNNVRLVGYISTGKDENGERKPLTLRWNGEGEKRFAAMSFELGVPRDQKDKDGKKIYDYPKIAVLGKTAEFIEKFFKPGDPIMVEGTLQTRVWVDKDGGKHYVTEVVVRNASFPLSKKDGNEGEVPARKNQAAAAAAPSYDNGLDDFEEMGEDDLPF